MFSHSQGTQKIFICMIFAMLQDVDQAFSWEQSHSYADQKLLQMIIEPPVVAGRLL